MDDKKRNLNFMFKKISVARPVMAIFLKMPEFVDQINKLVDKDVSITDEVVYNFMKDIYFNKCLERDSGQKDENFDFYNTRHSLKRLCKVLYNDPNKWRKDYEEFLKQSNN